MDLGIYRDGMAGGPMMLEDAHTHNEERTVVAMAAYRILRNTMVAEDHTCGKAIAAVRTASRTPLGVDQNDGRHMMVKNMSGTQNDAAVADMRHKLRVAEADEDSDVQRSTDMHILKVCVQCGHQRTEVEEHGVEERLLD